MYNSLPPLANYSKFEIQKQKMCASKKMFLVLEQRADCFRKSTNYNFDLQLLTFDKKFSNQGYSIFFKEKFTILVLYFIKRPSRYLIYGVSSSLKNGLRLTRIARDKVCQLPAQGRWLNLPIKLTVAIWLKYCWKWRLTLIKQTKSIL